MSINVGDLVQVIHWAPCMCGLGHIGTVLAPAYPVDPTVLKCGLCVPMLQGNHDRAISALHISGFHTNGNGAVPIVWLKRIPPLWTLEGQKTEEPLKIPVIV